MLSAPDVLLYVFKPVTRLPVLVGGFDNWDLVVIVVMV